MKVNINIYVHIRNKHEIVIYIYMYSQHAVRKKIGEFFQTTSKTRIPKSRNDINDKDQVNLNNR